MAPHIAEDWSLQDLEALQGIAMVALKESVLCHEASAPRGALILLAVSFEAALLAKVIAYEDQLRTAGLWPEAPSHQHLSELAELAHKMGWLSEPTREEIIEALNKVRVMVAHPGAYVRIRRNAPDLDIGDTVGYSALLSVVVKSTAELTATLSGPSSETDQSR